MIKPIQPSKDQQMSGMTADELLSEGFLVLDDLYDPDEEERKQAVAEDVRLARENNKPLAEYEEF